MRFSELQVFLRINMSVWQSDVVQKQLSPEQIRSILERITAGLIEWQKKRGVPPKQLEVGKSWFADSQLQWCMLFHLADENSNRMLDVAEFKFALGEVARVKSLSEAEVEGLFQVLDMDGSGQLSYEEFTVAVYQNESSFWPDLTETALRRLVRVIHNAAMVWLVASILDAQKMEGGDEFLAYKKEQTKRIWCWNEFVAFVHGDYPGLGVRQSALNTEELQGIWKALDKTRMGRLDVCYVASCLRRFSGELGAERTTEEAYKAKAGDTPLMRPASAKQLRELEKGWSHHCAPPASGVLPKNEASRLTFHRPG